MISAEKAAAASATVVAVTVNIETLIPTTSKAKKTTISLTRNGTRRKVSLNPTERKRAGNTSTTWRLRMKARSAPTVYPTTAPTIDRATVMPKAWARNDTLAYDRKEGQLLQEGPIHQTNLALTRNRWRPMSHSTALATKVNTT